MFSPALIRLEKLFRIKLHIYNPEGIEIINPLTSNPIKFFDSVNTISFLLPLIPFAG
jgi:hypothetical protein